MTVQELIVSAFRAIGIIAKSETPDNDEMQDALESLNMLLSNASGLMKRSGVSESIAVSDGTGSYTIGVGQTFNTAKPDDITSAFIRDSENMDTPLRILKRDQYDAITDKTTEARPEALFYDPGLAQQATQTGTIYLNSVPDKSYTLYITSDKPFTEFTALNETVTFEPKYRRALKYALGRELWSEYRGKEPIPRDLKDLIDDAVRPLQALNSRRPIMEIDVPGVGGTYNIYTDG